MSVANRAPAPTLVCPVSDAGGRPAVVAMVAVLVSALAAALGLGPLEWTTRRDPANGLWLVCRFQSGRELMMPTWVASRRDRERFASGVSQTLLAGVVVDIAD